MSEQDTTAIADRSQSDVRQVLNLSDLDGRTRPARRARQLIRDFTAALGGDVAPYQRVAIQRAAELTAIAEQTRALHLAGQRTIDDVVRGDNAAARAVTALRLPPTPMRRQSSFAEKLERVSAERAARAAVGASAARPEAIQAGGNELAAAPDHRTAAALTTAEAASR